MKKGILAVLVIGLLAACGLFLAGLNKGQPHEHEEGRYYDTKKDFSIRFPKDWTVDNDDPDVLVMAFSPEEGPNDAFLENVNVFAETSASLLFMSLGKYVDLNIENAEKDLKNFQEVDRGKATLDGEDAAWIVYTHRMEEETFKILVYIVVKGTNGYIVTCGAKPAQFAKFRPTFEKIATSFYFE